MPSFDKLFAKADKWLKDFKAEQQAKRDYDAALRREADKYYAASDRAKQLFGENGNVHILPDRDFKHYIRTLEINRQERPGITQRYRDFHAGREVFLQPSELEEFIDTINNPKDWAIED